MRDACRSFRVLCAATLFCLVAVSSAGALTDSFSYQGSLELSGQPANGLCDFDFQLWDAVGSGSPPTGGTQIATDAVSGVTVMNGLFDVALDFGNLFNTNDRWLQIGARCPAGSGSYTYLGPRQQLRTTPFANFAKKAGNVECSTCIDSTELATGAVVTAKISSGAVGSTEIADGSVASIDIANGTITSTDIAAGAVGSTQIAEGSVASVDITDGTITGADITDGTVGASDINTTTVQRRVSGSCVGVGLMSQINQDGTVLCAPPATGDITSVNAGNGLTGGGPSGNVTLSANFAGSGSATTVPRSDHNHFGQSWSGSATDGLKITLTTNGGTALSAIVNDGTGITGIADAGTGVFGEGHLGNGVIGTSDNQDGIYGVTNGLAPSAGVSGQSRRTNGTGVRGVADEGGSFSTGVLGVSNSGRGVVGVSSSGNGVRGTTEGGGQDGVYGESTGANGTGVQGVANNGADAYGVWGQSTSGFAGFFTGKVNITGTLTKAAGSFKIDHPLDPANKYLSHSFVESPDMMNIYNGNVLLDSNGEATVQMPAWFETLNREFRYQLTCIGANAPVFIAEEIQGNQFRIAGGSPGLKVSWQVTGVRQDAYANAHRIPVEEDKPESERGHYMHPSEAGQPESMGMQMLKAK